MLVRVEISDNADHSAGVNRVFRSVDRKTVLGTVLEMSLGHSTVLAQVKGGFGCTRMTVLITVKEGFGSMRWKVEYERKGLARRQG